MTRTILHKTTTAQAVGAKSTKRSISKGKVNPSASLPKPASMPKHKPAAKEKNPFLVQLGERARALREQRGGTRKALAQAAGVSERHLANMEYGLGNVSILVLLQVAQALQCSLGELLGLASSPHGNQSAGDGRRLGSGHAASPLIALVGLRGAGKSTLGQMLAEDLGMPFIELSREVEKRAGASIGEVQALYGQSAYRRYERRALDDTLALYPQAVIALPGGIVAEPATYNEVLSKCSTVWLQASAEDHMQRVAAQGDMRPMAASTEAMADLKTILAGRAAFYSKANLQLNTSAQPLAETYFALRSLVRTALHLPLP